MNEAALMIVLRLIHVIAGVFWAGTAFLIAWFLIPTHRATGQAGLTFVSELMVRRKLRVYLAAAMGFTILSGLAMYVRMMMLTHGTWAHTTSAKVLGFGAICAIIGGGVGTSISGRTGAKMVALGQQIQATGQPETDAHRAQIDGYLSTMQGAMRIAAGLILIAIATMASARYL
ncbi:MAG: hypothetical protein ABIQ55_05585 [Gemmatimonadaceae bacterium]